MFAWGIAPGLRTCGLILLFFLCSFSFFLCSYAVQAKPNARRLPEGIIHPKQEEDIVVY
jgi:hypothetical protein